MAKPKNRDGTLYVVIGCDCDPDRPQYGGVRYDSHEPLKWRGVREGVDRAREITEQIEDDCGNHAKITWCVRSDLQMQQIYGDCAWPYAEFAGLWESLVERGDEIAWHPHLWRWGEQHGCWYQEIEDASWMRDCLCQGYEALSTHMGRAPTTSRMGWEFHNDVTMQQVSELGIKVDFSAIPGRFTPGQRDKWGSRFNCYVDWRSTPERSYTPSASDYRREPRAGETALSVTEVPMSTFRSKLLGIGAHLRRVAKAKGRDRVKQLFTVSNGKTAALKAYITIHPYIFSRLVMAKIGEAKKTGRAVLVTAFHADEILGGRDHARSLYDTRHLWTNLERLRIQALRGGVTLRFATASAATRFTIGPERTREAQLADL